MTCTASHWSKKVTGPVPIQRKEIIFLCWYNHIAKAHIGWDRSVWPSLETIYPTDGKKKIMNPYPLWGHLSFLSSNKPDGQTVPLAPWRIKTKKVRMVLGQQLIDLGCFYGIPICISLCILRQTSSDPSHCWTTLTSRAVFHLWGWHCLSVTPILPHPGSDTCPLDQSQGAPFWISFWFRYFQLKAPCLPTSLLVCPKSWFPKYLRVFGKEGPPMFKKKVTDHWNLKMSDSANKWIVYY